MVEKEPFVANEVSSRIPFDPNVRLRLGTIPNELFYDALLGERPQMVARSSYYAMQVNGVTYHVFNAEKFPLGRMCVLAANYIRGKHRPDYVRDGRNGDQVVIVNAANLRVTGKKRDYYMYRKHTGYVGNM